MHRRRQAEISLARVHCDALVFTTANGGPQSRRNTLRAVHDAGDTAGLNARRASAKVTAQVDAGLSDKAKAEAIAKLVDAGFGT